MMLNCESCKTRKKIIGLGNMLIDCPSCKGIGWIEIPEKEMKVTLAEVINNPKKNRKKVTREPVLQC